MDEASHIGIILGNTGTPEAPTVSAVKRYLGQFLMDRRIVPMNRFIWWFILHCCILPKRAKASAAKYQSIWTPEGSPLIQTQSHLANGLETILRENGVNATVAVGMNYGSHPMKAAIKQLKKAGCTRVIVLPLYPQSAYSTTLAVVDAFNRAFASARWRVPVQIIPDYQDRPVYLKAIAASITHAGFRKESQDRLLFSFHSVPLKDIDAGDTYDVQTRATAQRVAEALDLEPSRWVLGYQDVFGKKPETWLSPLTEDLLQRWGSEGISDVYMVCPNFAIDCLETIYDIPNKLQPRYSDAYRDAPYEEGDGSFTYIPCLNATKAHVKVLYEVIREYL